MQPIKGQGGGCFAAGTMVATPVGPRAIEDLCVGDEVISFDHAGNLHTATVLKTLHHPSEPVYEFTFWGGLSIKATPNHWFLQQYGVFAEVGSLTPEDCAVDENGHLRPLIDRAPLATAPVFNLIVSGWHTFIANGFRVHNGGRGASAIQNHIAGHGGGGGKGGGGSGHIASEDPNTLRSKSVARFIDALSEGEIEGLVDGAKSIYFDDTQLQSDDGTYNFSGISYDQRFGLPSQTYISGFPQVESMVSIGAEVKKSSPVIRTIYDADADWIKLGIRIPSLTRQDTTNGDLHGSTVQLRVYVKPNGGAFEEVAVSREWSSFSGSTSQTGITGLRVQSSVTSPGGAASYAYSVTAQYRAVGAVDWIDIQTISTSRSNNYVQDSVQMPIYGESGIEGYYTVYTGGGYYASTTFLDDFEITGLTSGQYEIRIVGGTLNTASGLAPTPITISGKTTSPYEVQYRVPLPVGGSPWDVKVERLTDDSESVALSDDTFWSTYTIVVDHKLSYPNTAYIGLNIDTEQFGSNAPSRSYEIKGVKVKIPSNYNPITRAYTGIWDGTFQTAWSDNPAWVFYDILTNSRYGLGEYIAAEQVDKWSLYSVAQYCDELVDDGFGGQEPRFTFNAVINSREEAFRVIQSIASAFRGMAFWATGAVFASQDRPEDDFKVINNTDVIGGEFVYSGSALKARHTVANVTWNDPVDGYRAAVEVVEDADMIDAYGWRQTDMTAFGCTSRGQAHRFGKWILDSARHETDTVTYTASFDHFTEGGFVSPGHIIGILDKNYIGFRRGGRIASATLDTVELDTPVTISGDHSYTLYVTLPSGLPHSVATTNLPGEATVITLAEDLPDVPLTGALWGLAGTDVAPRKFRVLAVRETEKHLFEITALLHDPTKYARVEQDIKFDPPVYSLNPTGPLGVPSNITTSEYLYSAGPSVKSAATIGWTSSSDPRGVFTEVQVKRPGGTWQQLASTSEQHADLLDTTDGIHEIRVRSVDSVGRKSQWATSTNVLLGLKAPPTDVTGFRVNIVGNSAYLAWSPVTDLDISHYAIKYAGATSGATWGGSVTLVDKVSHPATSVTVPALVGSYLIKSVDYSGVECDNATVITSTITSIEGANVVEVITEDFSGDKTDVELSGGGIRLAYIDDVMARADWYGTSEWFLGVDGLAASGVYSFANTIDLTEVYTSRITAQMVVGGINVAADFFALADVFGGSEWFGADPSDWGVELQVRVTNDNPVGTPTWSAWMPFIVGDYSARAFEFRCVLTSLSFGVTPFITGLSVQIDMPDRVIGGNDIVCPAGGVRVDFDPAFKSLKGLGFNDQGMATGDIAIEVAKDATGFTRKYVNSLGADVARSFDYVATGYGRVVV